MVRRVRLGLVGLGAVGAGTGGALEAALAHPERLVVVVGGVDVALPYLLAAAVATGTGPAQRVAVALWTVERYVVLLPVAAA